MNKFARMCSYVPVFRAIPYLTAGLLGFFWYQSASAHHSFTAEFVADKTATLNGRISQVWFKNPHVRYLIEVENEEGDTETWDARGSPVVWLARKGWTADTIKVGDSVEMYGYLGRDGIKMLSIMTITLADGRVLTDKVPE